MLKVLLIDDEEVCNFITANTLQHIAPATKIEVARSGLAALDSLQHHENETDLPHLIFVDINMPFMNGFMFVDALQKLSLPGKEKMKIIMLSSSQDEIDIEQAKSLGVSYYLSKPLYDDAKLRTILAEADSDKAKDGASVIINAI